MHNTDKLLYGTEAKQTDRLEHLRSNLFNEIRCVLIVVGLLF